MNGENEHSIYILRSVDTPNLLKIGYGKRPRRRSIGYVKYHNLQGEWPVIYSFYGLSENKARVVEKLVHKALQLWRVSPTMEIFDYQAVCAVQEIECALKKSGIALPSKTQAAERIESSGLWLRNKFSGYGGWFYTRWRFRKYGKDMQAYAFRLSKEVAEGILPYTLAIHRIADQAIHHPITKSRWNRWERFENAVAIKRYFLRCDR